MNRKKWTEKQHTQEEWFAKLAEEFGEVAREITNRFDGQADDKTAWQLENELEHVEFIARSWRQAIFNGHVRATGVKKYNLPRPVWGNL